MNNKLDLLFNKLYIFLFAWVNFINQNSFSFLQNPHFFKCHRTTTDHHKNLAKIRVLHFYHWYLVLQKPLQTFTDHNFF